MHARVSQTRTRRVVVSAAVLSAILLVGIAAHSAEAGQPGTAPASSAATPEPGAELAAFRAATSESINCLCFVFTCPKDGFSAEGCNPGGFCGQSIAAASAVCEAHCGGSIAHRLCKRTELD
jgi:hypothetical protein